MRKRWPSKRLARESLGNSAEYDVVVEVDEAEEERVHRDRCANAGAWVSKAWMADWQG